MPPNSATVLEPYNACEGPKVSEKSGNIEKLTIVWKNVALLGILHIAAMYGLYLRHVETKLATIWFAKVIYIASGISITAGEHRLWCHKAYKANKGVQVVLMLLNCITYQNSIFTWSRDHRLHHKFTETDADPHNSNRGFFFSHVGWLLVKKHSEVKEKGKTIDMSDLKANKIIMFQHRYYHQLILLIGVIIPTFVPWYFWGETLKSAFFVATIYRYIITMHIIWSINSFAHMFGFRPYERDIGPSENNIPIYCTFGEGFHNYHHTFPWDYKASELGFDMRNLTTTIIDFFAWMGWAYDLRSVPREIVEKRAEKRGDGSYEKPVENKFKKAFLHVKHFAIYFLIVYLL